MSEGYYWISFKGIVQVGYYSNITVEDVDKQQTMTGLWHLVGEQKDVCGAEDVKVLSSRLHAP